MRYIVRIQTTLSTNIAPKMPMQTTRDGLRLLGL